MPLKTKQLLERHKEMSSSKADIKMGKSVLDSREASMTDLIAKSWEYR